MPRAYRIVKARRAADAFTGEGARQVGGRWNSPGHPAVYTAESASLAMLEVLVHVDRADILSNYVLFEVTFDASLVLGLDPNRLPQKWTDEASIPRLQTIGDTWIASADSAILKVPSAVVPIEYCYILNPRHPDYSKIKIGKPSPFNFDSRLLGPG